MALDGPGVLGTPTITVATPPPTALPHTGGPGSGYSPPTTRSTTRNGHSHPPLSHVATDTKVDDDPEYSRARSRSRSPGFANMRHRVMVNKLGPIQEKNHPANGRPSRLDKDHLAPPGYQPSSLAGSELWRTISRSPSPLGLIPIHRSWRQFIHKHEIPRKLLHSMIGVVTCYMYTQRYQSIDIWPPLMVATIPILGADALRFNWERFNRFYVRVLGAFMRENEYNQWNGVISYLLGAIVALSIMPNDVATVSILLLSWCDTAASTIGRRYGRYTPRIRKGKSLAGSAAALVTGVCVAILFWGYLTPEYKTHRDDAPGSHLFDGLLYSPWDGSRVISGWVALIVLSSWTGVVAAFSEAVDVFGIDDNLTIPLISGFGIWAFLLVFGPRNE